MMLRVQAISKYDSRDHPTRRKDFAIAESNFCRFLENHTPMDAEYSNILLKFRSNRERFFTSKVPTEAKNYPNMTGKFF